MFCTDHASITRRSSREGGNIRVGVDEFFVAERMWCHRCTDCVAQRIGREHERGRVEAWVMQSLQPMARTEQLAMNMENAEERPFAISQEMRQAGGNYLKFVNTEQRQKALFNSERHRALRLEAGNWQAEANQAMQAQRNEYERRVMRVSKEQAECQEAAVRQIRYEEEETEARRANQESAKLRGTLEEALAQQRREVDLRREAMRHQGMMNHAESVTRQAAEAQYQTLVSGNRNEWSQRERELEAKVWRRDAALQQLPGSYGKIS